MARREEAIAERLREAQGRKQAAEAEAQRHREAREALEAQRERLLARARDAADDLRRALEKELRRETGEARERWRGELAREQAAFLHDVRHRAAEQFEVLARQALADLASAELESQMARVLVERLGDLDAGHRDMLKQASAAGEPVRVRSAFELPSAVKRSTDGQIYLSPELFQKGMLPAVDVGRSVSRVGGKAQLPAYRAVAGELRLSYAQYEELQTFARFGTRLDPETRRRLERGKRVREVLRQSQYAPLRVSAQISVLLAATEGLFDALDVEAVADAEERVLAAVGDTLPELCAAIDAGEALGAKDRNRIVETARQALREGRG
jgi:F0F1-type ATP synthase membrane subunit b/b'